MANLKSVLKCWTEFNLPSLQKSLDTSASETATRQDESEKEKKKLIELTKEWKKNAEEDTRSKAAPLVKAFQKEIDSLNKRSKAAENTFLFLYKSLLEIPDPVPVLKQAETVKKQLEKAKDVEMENENLRKTLEEYHAEFADVKNQEVTLNKLRETLKELEEKSEVKIQERLVEREKIIQEKFEEKEREVNATQLTVATKLGEAEAKIKSLQEALQSKQSEVFDIKTKYEEEASARLSEIEILENDLERANQATLIEERNTNVLRDQIQSEFATKQINIGDDNNLDSFQEQATAELEVQLLSKENELSQLIAEVHHMQDINNKQKEQSEREITMLENKLEEKGSQLTSLDNHLKSQADYNDIKRELEILKMIEFYGEHGEQPKVTDIKSLERLLLEKNRALQAECTTLKMQGGELTGKLTEAATKANAATRTIADQQTLICQLESDLMNVNGLPSGYRGEGEGQAAGPSTEVEMMSKAVQDLQDEDHNVLAEKHSSDSILPIISSQRERFHTRNMQLESQSRQQQQQIVSLEGDVQSVRKDNVKLYEKIKFLQSYPSNKGSTSLAIDDASVARYESTYEDKIDPFSVFSKKEKQRKYTNLSAPEKVTLNMGRFILSNKVARTMVFFYTLMLHCLVFIVLYKFEYTEQCRPHLSAVHHDAMAGDMDPLSLHVS